MPFFLLGLGAPNVDLNTVVEGGDVFFANADQLRPSKRPCEANEDECHIPSGFHRLLFFGSQHQLDDVIFDQCLDAPLCRSLGASDALHSPLDQGLHGRRVVPCFQMRPMDGYQSMLQGCDGQGVRKAGEVFSQLHRCRGNGAAVRTEVRQIGLVAPVRVVGQRRLGIAVDLGRGN